MSVAVPLHAATHRRPEQPRHRLAVPESRLRALLAVLVVLLIGLIAAVPRGLLVALVAVGLGLGGFAVLVVSGAAS